MLASVGRLTPASQLMQAGSSQWSTLGAFEGQLGLQHSATSGYGPVGAPPPPPPPGQIPPPPGYGVPPPGYAPPPPGYGTATGYGSGRGPYTAFGRALSPWWKRAVALIIDSIVVGIPTSIISNAFGGGIETRTVDGETRFEVHNGGLIIPLVVGLLYYALLNGGPKGQTVGKMALRIQVRDIDTGGSIGVGRGFGRQLIIYVFTLACVIPLLLDYLSPLWDPKRQAWHDKVVRSVVVDVE